MATTRDRLTAHCKRCRTEIAEWAGPDHLLVGGARIRLAGRRVVLDCPRCGAANRFFPRSGAAAADNPLDNTDAANAQ